MNRLTLLVAVSLSATLLAVGAAAVGGDDALSPGPVHGDHADATCGGCHEPWAGVTDGGCLDCHGEVAEAGDGLHADLVRRCVECHLDHRGAGASITFAIDHDALEGNLSGRCEGCHEGDLEEEFGRRGHWDKGCGDCHGTENWGRIRLDHREYFPLRTEGHWGLDCESCHPDSRAKGFEETTCSPGWGLPPPRDAGGLEKPGRGPRGPR